LRERVYFAAIEEFKIAISLSPNTQSTAVFKTNLGNTYMIIGYPDMARQPYEEALKAYGLNLQYYFNLVECYKKLGITDYKIIELKKSTSVYDKITLGILYINNGETTKGIVALDDFCFNEPDLLITPAIKQYIKKITSNQ
jgi:tetratricopeptide (TPR) repeat protein